MELASRVAYVMRDADKPMQTVELKGLGHYLVQDGLLSAEVIHSAIQSIQKQGLALTTYLVEQGIMSSQHLLNYCVNKFGLPVFDLKQYDLSWLQNPIIKLELICHYHVLPLHKDQTSLSLALSDPTHYAALNAIGFYTGLCVKPMLVEEWELNKIIKDYCNTRVLHSQLESTLSKIAPLEEKHPKQDTHGNDEPIIAFVDNLLNDAIAKKISDIHIEPYAHSCRIRFRCDGLLQDAMTLPNHLAVCIISRLKILANLNIAEKRLPQDGRLSIKNDSHIDIRINTCPTLYGEKMVLRLLNTHLASFALSQLGLMPEQHHLLLEKLSHPQGLILVTGPTGSGKTVTLYSALHHLNHVERNISTVEDPVEIELQGINQVNINPSIGLDFASALKTFLRQDPDVMMVGEIRDKDTALIAMQAAQTGHLVLSTMHTNNAFEAITRLQSMGISTDYLIHSLTLIIAQRLLRQLCPICKKPDPNHEGAYQAQGCSHCHQGYKGRIGVFELIPITQELATLISSHTAVSLLKDKAKNRNWPLLWEAGLRVVAEGITSHAELCRVIGCRE